MCVFQKGGERKKRRGLLYIDIFINRIMTTEQDTTTKKQKKVKCIDNATFDAHLDFQNPNSEVRERERE